MIAEFRGDIESLRGVVDRWRGESKVGAMHFGEINVFMQHLKELVEGVDTVLLAMYDDGRPVGFIGGQLFISHLNGKLCANEQGWYVLPEHRGIRAVQMKRALEKWAYDNGAYKFLMTASILAGDNHDRICKMYEKDMTLFETTYIKDLR